MTPRPSVRVFLLGTSILSLHVTGLWLTLPPGMDSQESARALLLGLLPAVLYLPVLYGFLRSLRTATDTQMQEEILSAGSEGILSIDDQGTLLAMNHAARQLFAERGDDLLGQNIRRLIPDLDADFIHRRLALAPSDSLGAAHALVGVRRDGSTLPLRLRAREIPNADGVRYLLFIQDISHALAVEEALMRSNELLERIFSNLHSLVAYLDAEGNYIRVNRAFAERCGHAPDFFVGKNHLTLYPDPVKAGIFRRVASTGEAYRGDMEPFPGLGGPASVWSWQLQAIRSADGPVEALLLTLDDVTERRQSLEFDALMQEMDEQVLRGSSRRALLEFACERLVQVTGLRLAWFGERLSDGRIDIVAGSGPASGHLKVLRRDGLRWDAGPAGNHPAGLALRTGKRQIADASDALCRLWLKSARVEGLQAVIAFPLVLRGEIHGVLCLYAGQAAIFENAEYLRRLDGILSHIGIALEIHAEQEQVRLLSTALSAASNAVFITNRQGRIEWANAAFCELSGYAMHEVIGQNPRLLKSGQHDASYYKALWQTILAGHPWHSETVERNKDGQLYTVKQTITPIRNEAGEVSHFITIHEDITAQKQTEERIKRMAHFDALTALPNRNLFYDRLQQAMQRARRERQQLALLFLDLDRFKQVNDTLGHAIGDLLLVEVAQRLRSCVRESDTVARLAGDEFTVILPNTKQAADAGRVAEKIVQAIGQPFELDGHEVRIGTSIGIALYPQDARDPDELVRLADAAMYRAKTQGRNAWCYHAAQDAA